MTVRRGLSFFYLILIIITGVSGFERADLRLAPSIGWGFLKVESERSYGDDGETGMNDFCFGIDLFLERQTGNRDLFIGGSLGCQFMIMPFTDDSSLGDNPDICLSQFFAGPSFRYYLDEKIYILGTFGLAILWTAGDDDFLDTNLFGPGFSFGGGYDFPVKGPVQYGFFARIFCSFLFGDDKEKEIEYSGSQLAPSVGVAMLF